MTRREFTSETVLLLLSGVAITVSACDSRTAGAPLGLGPSGPGGGAGARAGSVSANHGHAATISSAQLASGNAVTLNVRGSADHPHTVQLTVQEVMQIAGGQQVIKTSSTDSGHDHLVTFN